MTDTPSDSSPENDPDDRTVERWFVGPSQTNRFKFMLAGFVFWLVRTSPISKYIIRIPGATKAGVWAFKIRVMSRDFEQVNTEHITDTDTDNKP